MTYKKIGGKPGERERMYSIVVYDPNNSAGRLSWEMLAYCGGNWFLLKQNGQIHIFELTSIWLY